MADNQSNLSQVLQLVWRSGEISRADVARHLDLSRSTVSALVQQLLDIGVVHEARIGRSRGGRPPVMLRFSSDAYRLVGVDLGASHINVIVMDPRGKVLGREAREHPVEWDPAGSIVTVNTLIGSLIDRLSLDRRRLVGLGVAVPSPVHTRTPGELSPSILPAWKGIPLARTLSKQWSLPTYLENDANLGALGELVWGEGKGAVDLAYVKLATGVGAGLIVNGELYRGAEGIAGEVGHTAIDANGPRCRCGLNGCLETFIGSQTLEANFRRLHAQGQHPTELEGNAGLRDIAVAAAAGDPLALAVIRPAGSQLGMALANLLNIVNPSRIVLGGRLAMAGEALLAPAREAIQARAMWSNVDAADVVTSSLGDDAVPIGAATLVLRTALADPPSFARGLPPFVPSRSPAWGAPPTRVP